MRLLNTTTLRLESLFGSSIPEYAILSHTWCEDEVLFDDIRDSGQPLPVHKKGFAKVKGSCEQAIRHGYRYIWIDTCCIDKSSSAELSEAINSMFQWYHDSGRCYAYLADVNTAGEAGAVEFEASRWFTRGWTLQELIAPQDVCFYDANWSLIGRRQPIIDQFRDCPDLAERISKMTGIPIRILHWYSPSRHERGWLESMNLGIGTGPWQRQPTEEEKAQLLCALRSFSIAQRMSWAALRQTTRVEDRAYSLLGLFEVNMPMLYGEGRRAFYRLQQEILKESDDHSILAFAQSVPPRGDGGSELLADSPACFAGSIIQQPEVSGAVWPGASEKLCATELSPLPKALEVGLCLCPLNPGRWGKDEDRDIYYLGILDCVYGDDLTSRPAIFLEAVDKNKLTFRRVAGDTLKKITPLDMDPPELQNKGQPEPSTELTGRAVVPQPNLAKATFKTVRLYCLPPEKYKGKLYKPRVYFPFGRSTMAVRIKLQDTRGIHLSQCAKGAYPQAVQVDSERSQVYIPSEKNGGEYDLGNMSPFGVLILQLSGMGTLVLLWGSTRRGDSPEDAWFAVSSWAEAAEICGLALILGPDLSEAARLVFEQRQSWAASTDVRRDGIVEADLGSQRVGCNVDTVDFFGRRVLNIDVRCVARRAQKIGRLPRGPRIQSCTLPWE
ncbi:putative vegetative incompatibility protein HET-E-1 [Parachaetomium inaequale]|uniref:Vegetative incompatibility protein HET-E-1 n=1 Tax=Parachaetomium inaequale TaxID=2588326 RepID=A0AAN6PF17_9PEZI|nr:putative vegetative incompatibility protein HET-E-1 [Parachaetomium inaequale]